MRLKPRGSGTSPELKFRAAFVRRLGGLLFGKGYRNDIQKGSASAEVTATARNPFLAVVGILFVVSFCLCCGDHFVLASNMCSMSGEVSGVCVCTFTCT